MKNTITSKALSLLLAAVMLIVSLPLGSGILLAEETLSLNVNVPFHSEASFVANGETVTSKSFRIPAMVKLSDGTIVAASDIRWNTTFDGGGLDTLVARSTDGGVTWSYVTANYLGDNENTYNGSQSTAFIDPCLTVGADGKTVYMLVDIYPYGVALNGSGNTAPSTEVGFTDDGYLKLSKTGESGYNYYLKDGYIWKIGDNKQSGYTVDNYFNLYYNGEKTSNLFFSDSDFKVVRTGYLYLTKSTDGGITWSAPTLLDLKTSSEQVCLVGPGRGITTSSGKMIFPVYSYNGTQESQRMGFIYSDDGVNWSRVQSSVNWSSEAAVVELKSGELRFFYRNGTTNLCYVDYDLTSKTWSSTENTGIDTNSNTQISAITYSKTSDGKQVILVSCPAGPNGNGSDLSGASYRSNGRIFVFTVDGTSGAMTLKNTINVNDNNDSFMYSCLTERSDGSVAILFENHENAWGAGTNCYYTMDMSAYSSSALGLTFDESSGGDEPTPNPVDPTVDYELTLDIGATSPDYTVSDSTLVGTEGTHTTSDGAVSYTVIHTSREGGYEATKVTSLTSGAQIVISDGNGNYLSRNGTTIENTTDPSNATVWTVGTSGNYFTLSNGGYYLRPRTSSYNYSLNLSNSSSNTSYRNWSYDSSTGLYYSNYNYSRSYLNYNNGWNVSTNASEYGAAYTVTEKEEIKTTKVTFTGLSLTEGTLVSIGDTTYNVIVNAKQSNVTKMLLTGESDTLDAVFDLGLSGDEYTVDYEITGNDSLVITLNGANVQAHESNNGSATVTATVKNSSGSTVGTVVYTIAVSDVVITDTKSIHLSKGGSATIEGLTGEITSTMLDTGIATVAPSEGTLSNEEIVITGVDVGTTSIVVGTVQIVIHVNPGTDTTNTTSKYIYIYVDEISNCNVYYSINAGPLLKIEGTGILIDQTYIGGFNIMFFSAPFEGYALIKMNATDSQDQYYSISGGSTGDGTDTDAWPLEEEVTEVPASGSTLWKDTGAGTNNHGLKWCLLEGNMTLDDMKELFTRALSDEIGAHGVTTFTKNAGDGLNTHLSFVAEKLPTLEKTIQKVVRDGNEIEFTEDTRLRFGDIITYQFKITTYSEEIEYSDITLKDEYIGYSNPLADGLLNDADQTFTYTADYTINQADAEKYSTGSFINKAELEFTYKSTYSSGNVDEIASASVSCRISGIVYYTWMDGLPDGITSDSEKYPRPGYQVVQYGSTVSVKEYEGLTSYTVYEGDVAVGTWQFKGWKYRDTIYTQGDTVVMPMNENVNFIGMWEFVTPPRYTVVYKWTNAPAGVVLPTNTGEYYENQKVTVDSEYYPGKTVEVNSVKWTFSGWMLDGSVAGSEITVKNENIVLVGVWSGESMLTSLKITKKGWSSSDKAQSFVFVITDGEGLDLRVTVKGNSTTTVEGLRVGAQYTVTEETDWSWRYSYEGYTTELNSEAVENGAKIILGDTDNEIVFENERTNEQWLDGDSWLDNIFSLFK